MIRSVDPGKEAICRSDIPRLPASVIKLTKIGLPIQYVCPPCLLIGWSFGRQPLIKFDINNPLVYLCVESCHSTPPQNSVQIKTPEDLQLRTVRHVVWTIEYPYARRKRTLTFQNPECWIRCRLGIAWLVCQDTRIS